VDDSVTLREFERLAQRLGISIKYTREGPSGLCTVKGNRVMYIDRTLDAESRIKIFIREFRSIDLGGYFVVPLIRKLLGTEDEEF